MLFIINLKSVSKIIRLRSFDGLIISKTILSKEISRIPEARSGKFLIQEGGYNYIFKVKETKILVIVFEADVVYSIKIPRVITGPNTVGLSFVNLYSEGLEIKLENYPLKIDKRCVRSLTIPYLQQEETCGPSIIDGFSITWKNINPFYEAVFDRNKSYIFFLYHINDTIDIIGVNVTP